MNSTVRWSQGSIGRARALDVARLKRERETVFDFLETVVTANEEQFQDLFGASCRSRPGKARF